MRGLELMLMSIYAMRNGTNYTENRQIDNNGNDYMGELGPLAEASQDSRPTPIPKHFTVTTWQNMPYSGYTCNNGTCKGSGYAFELLSMLQEQLHFTYTLIPPEESKLGDKHSGMMGQLYNKEVDMAIAFIPLLPELAELCTFSTIMDEIEVTFLMKRPRESATGSGLLAPFSTTVWYCILISLIVVGPIIYVLLFIRVKISERGHPEGYSLFTCVWFAYGALLKQGSTTSPETDSARVLFATWWIFITILTSFYTANLTAFLTLSEFTLPFNDVQGIVDYKRNWFAFPHYTVENVLNSSQTGSLEPLKTSLKQHRGQYIKRERNNSFILDYILQSDKLFLGDKIYISVVVADDYEKKTARGVLESKRCTYVMLPGNLYNKSRAFAFAKDTPFQDKMNRQLMILRETGMVEHLRRQDLPSVKICPLNLKSTERRLGLADLRMTFKVIGLGFGISTLAFIGEMTYRFCNVTVDGNKDKCCWGRSRRQKAKARELPVYSTDPRPDFLKKIPYPTYEGFNKQNAAQRHFINGRDYWVIRENDGDRRLVPIRTPSALLF